MTDWQIWTEQSERLNRDTLYESLVTNVWIGLGLPAAVACWVPRAGSTEGLVLAVIGACLSVLALAQHQEWRALSEAREIYYEETLGLLAFKEPPLLRTDEPT